jgi:uncharacterized cupin superfamily protein
MTRPPNVVHRDQVQVTRQAHGERFEHFRRALGAASGGKKISANFVELPPGKRSWPYHAHAANEEAIFILEGEGVLRQPSGETAVRAGHYIAFPVGLEHAHQLINRSEAPLRYLVVATVSPAEIAHYPDSGKIGLLALAPPGLRQVGYLREADYWDGEETER